MPAGQPFSHATLKTEEDGLDLDIVDSISQDDVCDLAGNALDIAPHGFADGITENKPEAYKVVYPVLRAKSAFAAGSVRHGFYTLPIFPENCRFHTTGSRIKRVKHDD